MNLTALHRAGICLIAAATLAAPSAFALLDLDHAAIILRTEGGVSYDSNILGRNGGDGDTTFTFSPSLEYQRAGGRGTIDLSVGGSIVAYASESSRNHNNYRASGQVTVPVSPDSPFSGAFNASYGRSTNANATVGDLVTTNSLNAGFSGAYAFSERLSGTAGFNYGTNQNNGYGDNTTWSGSVGLAFQELIFRRLPLNVSYAYSSDQSTNDPTSVRKLNTKSHSFNIGTSGQITPKVQGSISVGYRSTDDTGTISQSGGGGLTAATNLNWAYDELTTVGLGISKSLAVTVDNESTDTTTISLNWNRKLSEQLSANVGASHSWMDYRGLGRNDKLLGLSAGLSYIIRRNWTAGLHYQFSQNNSDLALSEFDRHVIGATISGRF